MERLASTPGQTPDSFHSAMSSSRSNARSVTTNGSQPDAAILAHYMAALGIEENEEDELGWIAEIGLQAELPPGWTCRTDAESGAIYYVDNDSLASTWEHPLVPFLRRVVEIGRQYLDMPSEGFFQEQKTLLWQGHKEELESWHGPIKDDEGNSYFVNSADGRSSWQDPRLARSYIYDLQCGLLNHIENILAAEEDTGCYGGGTPWEVDQGAVTLAPQSIQDSRGFIMARLRQGLHKREDHAPTLERMSHAANWLHTTVKSEEESQHMRLIKKAEERRMRKLNRKLSKTIHQTVTDITADNGTLQSERRNSRMDHPA